MSSWISDSLRRLVAERAGNQCEYCLIREFSTHLGCEVDHVISEKHGGKTIAENLAYACFYCNRYKGSDIATLDPFSDKLVPLFNPRVDRWRDHFEYKGTKIEGRTSIGAATARLLGFNLPERLLERSAVSP